MNNLPISDFRRIRCIFKSGSDSNYIMHKDHVARFLKATLELHFSPGINPSNKNKTAEVRQIFSGQLTAKKAYWWSTPGLGDNDDEKGAVIMDCYTPDRIWVHPEIQAAEEAEYREQD